MRIKGIDFPPEIINAREEGNLVIFAGAGVSIGPPSKLPGFKELAEQMAEHVLTIEENEPPDRILGRLERENNIPVHQQIKEKLGCPNSKPTSLHQSIVSLFDGPDTIRIVTTNADRHFSTIVKECFQDDATIYCAPALPLGHEFNGIVYLHGSVDNKDPKQLVFTDGDFGRAYLTQGWATRFLVKMFEQKEYKVLFIGYSHDDPVMRYLARGLVPGTSSRYALTEEGKNQAWEFLGITPLTYPMKNETNKHSALDEAVADWAERARMGAMDQEREIREIVELPPPIDTEASDKIVDALKSKVKVRFFARYARDPAWLRWIEAKNGFEKLFQPSDEYAETDEIIASWFAGHFICQHADESLALVQRQGQRLNSILWQIIAHKLFSCNPRPEAKILAKWVTVLISTVQPHWHKARLNHLISECRYPEDRNAAILLFEYLTRPRLELVPLFNHSLKKGEKSELIDAEIIFGAENYSLSEAWQKIFKPQLDDFYAQVEQILTSQLTQIHQLFCAWDKAGENYDLISSDRSAIELHEQDRNSVVMDIIIDASRETIEWMLAHVPERANTVIEAWSRSDVMLLKRLAIHAITENQKMNPDEKIGWVLEKNWIYTYGLKHEIYRFFEKAYPKATEQVRRHLMEQVKRGPQEVLNNPAYTVYNLLGWLAKIAPECNLAAKSFKAMQEAHPDFKPRSYPDLYSGSSPVSVFAGGQSPISLKALIAKNPRKEIDLMLTYKGETSIATDTYTDREDFLDVVDKAAAQDFSWSWQLVVALQEKEEWKTDLWESLFRGWQAGDLSETEWKQVLALLKEGVQLHAFSGPIADLLVKAINKEKNGLPFASLALAESLVDQLWDGFSKKDIAETETLDQEWLTKAINHPGGKLANFWLYALSKQRQEAGADWSGLPQEYLGRFTKIITNKSYAAQMGRVVLASQTHFLFGYASGWTRERIIPLFDWQKNERQAQQAWHGYVFCGRLNEEFLADLLPLYEQTFSRLSREPERIREQFCVHLAVIAVYSPINPVEHGWLKKFISQADPKERVSWAGSVG